MPKLIFTQEEIDNIIKERSFHVYHKKSCDLAEDMAVHADGLFPRKLINERRPNEPAEVFEYRKKVWEPKTKPAFSKIFSSLQKIRRSSDWSIRYEGEFSKIAEGETLEDYADLNYPKFGSVTNWVFTLLLRKYLIDANCIIYVAPVNTNVNENEYLKPVAEVYDSKNVIKFIEDDYAVLLNPIGATYYSGGKPVEGKSYTICTTQQILRYDQIDGRGRFSLTYNYPHNMGYLPAFPVKGILIEQNGESFLYETRISGILPELNEAVREYSDLQAGIVTHLYPERWEITQHECVSCKGTGLRQNPAYTGVGCGCEPTITCDKCNGRAYTVAGPYSKILIKPAGMGEQNIPTPPAGFVEKDVEIIKVMDERVEKHIYSALSAINFEFLAKTPLSESGVAKEVDKDELNNTVHSIAEDIVACMDNIYWLIALWRYGTLYGENDIAEMVPTISVPEKFDILSADHLQEELKGAKEAKFNPVLLNAMEKEYATKKFNSDPRVSELVTLILTLDPLPNISEDDKMSRLSNKGITLETYVISSNIQSFVQRAIQEDEGFVDKDLEEQQEVMKKYAQEVIDSEEEAATPAPDTGLNDNGEPVVNPNNNGQQNGMPINQPVNQPVNA